jgi:hypothetical protein
MQRRPERRINTIKAIILVIRKIEEIIKEDKIVNPTLSLLVDDLYLYCSTLYQEKEA